MTRTDPATGAPGPRHASPPARPSGLRADLVTVGAALAFLAAALVVGVELHARDVPVLAASAPFLAYWEPHVGWGTPLAVLAAAGVVTAGPPVAARMAWGRLLGAAYLTALAWAVSLALSRDWYGIVGPPGRHEDYLTDVPDAPPVAEILATFTERIAGSHPENWITHVAGHPPGAYLTYVGLDRVGLGGPAWAAATDVLVGVAAVPAIALAVRSLAGEAWARLALPFLVLFPGAVFVAVSADAIFLAVTAWGFALLALATGARGRRHDVQAAGAGLLFGLGLFLSYGVVLLGLPVLALLWLRQRPRTLVLSGLPVVAVVGVFAAYGFVWWEGYQALVPRYYAGWGGDRPYAYWVWANLAVQVAVIGPAACAGLRRMLAGRHGGSGKAPPGLVVLLAGMLVVVAAATLSGMSKAETERIWLPFTAWFVVACAALPVRHHRGWLTVQVATALAVEHLMVSSW
ncbi:MAG: hypothetical protein ACRDYU_18070 [Actinomycetes bacterium]